MPIGRFLCGIAALIWDPATDQYLLLRRAESKDFGARSWECPTGRVDQGESFTAAVQATCRIGSPSCAEQMPPCHGYLPATWKRYCSASGPCSRSTL